MAPALRPPHANRREGGPATVMKACLLLASCVTAAGQMAPGYLTRVERNWYVLPSEPVGAVVARVQRGGHGVTFGLETAGPPAPFAIDPRTGVVTVNDTLADKENRSYSLWVTAYDGSIPQRTEVFASITDNAGHRPKIPHPPAFSLPKYPSIPLQPKFVPTTTSATTETVQDSTPGPPETPADVPTNKEVKKKNESAIVVVEEHVDLPLVVPLVVIAAMAVVAMAVVICVCSRSSLQRTKSKKKDMNKDCGIVLQDSMRDAGAWGRPRVCSNRYEAWDNNHLQVSNETAMVKEEPRDEWEFPRHRLRIFNIVGEGAFGQVWRAQATDIDGKKGEVTVAVKTLKENASEKEKSDLLQELGVMKSLGSHPNVVRLVGCCTEKEPTLVIMEFVSAGKLQQYLRESRAGRHYGNTHGDSACLTSRDLTHFAYQVARGMEFLSSKGIIHRDLAARNVLITEEKTCKVADFGFARDVAGTHVYERKSDGRLPIRWMAPESLYDDIFSVKSDTWSFGVLLWEIVTLGSTPYPGLSAADVMKKVRDGHRLEKPEHCRRELYNIMFYCWEAEPALRPDFKELVEMLERLLCTETDYIELERFPDHSYYNVQHLDGEKL